MHEVEMHDKVGIYSFDIFISFLFQQGQKPIWKILEKRFREKRLVHNIADILQPGHDHSIAKRRQFTFNVTIKDFCTGICNGLIPWTSFLFGLRAGISYITPIGACYPRISKLASQDQTDQLRFRAVFRYQFHVKAVPVEDETYAIPWCYKLFGFTLSYVFRAHKSK